MNHDARMHELAGAILDSSPIDWSAVESSVEDAFSRKVVRELGVIARIASVHGRELPVPAPDTEEPIWGPLRIIEKIGDGAYGEVFRAWDSRLDREVALKLLPADSVRDGRSASSIIKEGRLLARVRHPNVVTVYGAEQIGDRVGVWMELVRGRTLEQVLTTSGPFNPGEAARIGVEVCRAVSAVHAAGLLHRDIKAHTVMLADDGRVVLMDFGTGREIDDRSAIGIAGTPLYLAPEVLAGHSSASVQSDIYGIGVLLFHLLSASYPVQARSTAEVRRAHEQRLRTDMRTARTDVPRSLARVIERALDPDPGHRQQRADVLADELSAWPGNPRRGYALLVAVATVVAVLLGTLAFRTNGRGYAAGVVPASATAGPVGEHRNARVPAIAVLPFESLTLGGATGEFADGLSYEILRILSVTQGLETRAAASSFTFRNRPLNVADVGSQLSADYILTGSVFQSGTRVRVYARLTRVEGNVTIWVNKFEKNLTEMFDLQDEISLAIVNALGLSLGRGHRKHETRPDVYYEFLRGVGLRAMRHPENASRAAAVFEGVVARDSEFAAAWAALASAAADASRFEAREEMPPPDPRMEPAAVTAIDLDPNLAEAHAAMGNVHARNRDWADATKSFLTALDLNPSLTTTHADFVLSTLLPMGRYEEAIAQLEEARRIDPMSLDVRRVLALLQVDTGRYADAIESARWVLARDPKFPYADLWLGRALVLSGRADEALPIFARNKNFWGYLGHLYAVTGRRDEAEALAARHPEEWSRLMLIYGGLGDSDRAFTALEHTAALNWWRAATWMGRPELAILRGDPRLNELRDRLGLPPLQ